jgi:hypothetical protein
MISFQGAPVKFNSNLLKDKTVLTRKRSAAIGSESVVRKNYYRPIYLLIKFFLF